jgi:hypothetical protein
MTVHTYKKVEKVKMPYLEESYKHIYFYYATDVN